MASPGKTVRVEFRDDIAVLQMLSADNKWNLQMINDLGQALDQVESNKSIKGLVVTGEGKFFLYGWDVKWLAQQSAEVVAQFLEKTTQMMHRMVTFPVVTVAAINGHAFGQGAIMSLACDHRVMNSGGRGWWCLPETKLKIKLVNSSLASVKCKITRSDVLRDAAMFSKRYPVEDALKAGIIDQAVQDNELIPAGIRYCKEMSAGMDREVMRSLKERLYGNDILAADKKDQEFMSSMVMATRLLAVLRRPRPAAPAKSKM